MIAEYWIYKILLAFSVVLSIISIYNNYRSIQTRRKWERRVNEAEALARSIASLVEDANREAGGVVRLVVEIGPDDWKIIEKSREESRVSRLN